MALNRNSAYVNCSQTAIPIYASVNQDKQVGTIYNSEMYSVTTLPDVLDSYPYMTVTFRDANGNKATGCMQTGKLAFSDEPAYLADQVLFHRRNSDGKTLVKAEATKIASNDTLKYMIFTVNASVGLYNNTTFVRNLDKGTRIAMDGSTVGAQHPERISVDYVEELVNGRLTWVKKSNAWVDLGYHIGSSPHNRALW
ncbi:hypothetical protein [Acetatifactor muris]|uniref:hypothetical protein n=1 Tax=Acetatifactor muris TaxID=879566 RepID=UPI0023F3B911|nr:hypothetical protein [Acetatifactor muris]